MNSLMSREMNPLKIDLVLEILFSFCPVKTLKSCRLVSKQWMEVSLKTWRNKAVLCPGKETEGLKSIQKYLNLLQSNSQRGNAMHLRWYPFKNFQIQSSSIKDYLKASATPVSDIARHVILSDYKGELLQINEFLSKFHSLDILELKNCVLKWSGEESFQPSNVKRLKIFRDITHAPTGLRIWEHFLTRFENLEVLAIEFCPPKDCMTDISWIMGSLRNIVTKAESKAENIMPLKELEVIYIPQTRTRSANPFREFNMEMDIITPLVRCHFPLTRLTFHAIWEYGNLNEQFHPLYSLLDTCKETLQYLNTSILVNVCESFETRPYMLKMDALEEVKLSNGLWGFLLLEGLEMANLKKLVIDCDKCMMEMEDGKKVRLTVPHENVYGSLETLDVLDNRKIPGSNTVRAFAKIMPNLVNLTMPLDKLTFAIVCKSFKGLKTLNVLAAQCRYEQLDDETLTGISKGKGPGEPRRPNITDLIHLTDLKIACETELQGQAPFSEHSVTYGFLQLPRLHSLSIHFKEISDENMAKLVNHVRGYVSIKVKDKSIPESYCDVEVGFGEL